MFLNLLKNKKQFFIVFCLLSLGACKQSEFYAKEGLSEVGPEKMPGTEISDVPNTPATPATPPATLPDTTPGPGPVTPPIIVVTPPTIPVIPGPIIPDPVVPDPTTPVVILNDRSEIFTQNIAKNANVDILWVIDDSGSMADEQDALGKNFLSFINQFIEKNIDFKMAITTTDGTSTRNGKMVGDSSMLTSASAKGNKTAFVNNFTKWVKVGTSGSGIEQGLKTSASFSDRYASSFLRPDAFFIIVYISDEEDQSDKKVSEYLTQLQSLKTNKGMVKAYSIVTVKDYGFQWETIGNRYMEISNATAGAIGDIKKDFSSTLLDMGGKILTLLDTFALNESPYQDQIEVFVNNIKITSGFVFNPAQRTVKFETSSLPAEGAQVEIRYKVKANVLGAI